MLSESQSVWLVTPFVLSGPGGPPSAERRASATTTANGQAKGRTLKLRVGVLNRKRRKEMLDRLRVLLKATRQSQQRRRKVEGRAHAEVHIGDGKVEASSHVCRLDLERLEIVLDCELRLAAVGERRAESVEEQRILYHDSRSVDRKSVV